MPVSDALSIFRKYGVDIAEMPFEQIHKLRNSLLRRYHPDAGGTIEIAQEINAAFDSLQAEARGLSKPASQPRPQAGPPSRPDQWAWAGHAGPGAPNSTISRSDFTDPNFIKKSMWELSGKSDDEWTIYGYDGSLFTNSIDVYANRKIFYYMAIAMIDLQTKGRIPLACRAVFARPGVSNYLYLIYLDGKHHDEEPIKFLLASVEVNRINHSDFIRKLPDLLDHLEEEGAGEHNLVVSE